MDRMTTVEREAATYKGEPVDRLVRRELTIFKKTFSNWKAQGWDGNLSALRLDPYPYCEPLVNLVGIDVPICPEFEECVVKREGQYTYYRTKAGGIEKFTGYMERWDEIMPEYVSFPVETKDDWYNKIKPRLHPDSPERWVDFDTNLDVVKRQIKSGEKLYEASCIGAFMYLRALLGPTTVLYTFYDDPELIIDMLETWYHLVSKSLLKVQRHVPFFKFLIGEDISYKNGLLISPAMVNRFLRPYYERLLNELRGGQAEHIYAEVDSDGNMDDVLPLYKSMGFDAMRPFEVAAGCDVVKLGKQYPDMVMSGGIDKRILASSKKELRDHLEYIIPAMFKRGRYMPTCDHSVPSNVPFENYLYYHQLLDELESR